MRTAGTDARTHGRRGAVARTLFLCACASAASVRLMAQCPGGEPPPCAGAASRRPAPLSIAVLPFVSRSPDTSQAYLADGMTDEIANQLTRLARLEVRTRSLVAAQWRRTPDPVEAARRLNVAWFVHGSVAQAGQQLVLSVQLVRATTGVESWAQRFPRSAGDVFAVQTEVAESVAAQVAGRLDARERAVLARRPTRNDDAYRLYLRGNALLRQRTEREVRQALGDFQEAVRLDPRFAQAWARVGFAFWVQSAWSDWHRDIPGDSQVALARRAAQRALGLDSLSSDAWMTLGRTAHSARDFARARTSFERAIHLDSLNADAYHGFGVMYESLQDYHRAEPLIRRAVAIDPLMRNAWRQLGTLLARAERLPESEAVLDTALSFGPWQPAFDNRAQVRFLRGNGAGALADLDESERMSGPSDTLTRAVYRVAIGDSTQARAVLAAAIASPDTGNAPQRQIVRFATALGRYDEALAAAARLRQSLVTWGFLHGAELIPLRADPRFIRIMEASRPQVPWAWQ